MSPRVVLISGLGGDIGQAVAKSLADKPFYLIGCDMNDVLFFSIFVKRFYRVIGVYDSDRYLDLMKKIIQKEKISFFIPTSEAEIIFWNCHREVLEEMGVKVLINHSELLNIFFDKAETASFLKKSGFPYPKTFILKDFNTDAIPLPVIVKSRRSCGSQKIWKAENANDLEYLRQKDDGSFIAQEYLGEEESEYTTGVFSDGKQCSSITFRRSLGFNGVSRKVTLTSVPFLHDLSSKIALAVGLKGSINIQSRKVGEIFIPFEVNPRISSTVIFRKFFGFEDVWWWLEILSGKSYVYKERYHSGQAERYLTEFFIDPFN